jgi:hypothetical protein
MQMHSVDWLIENKEQVCKTLRNRAVFGYQSTDDIVFEVAIIVSENTHKNVEDILKELDEEKIIHVFSNCI